MQSESLKNTGRTSADGNACETSSQMKPGELTLSLAATPANRTVPPSVTVSRHNRASAVSSSALLMHFARALWSERIRPSCEPMLPGLGGECELSWNRLVTLCCPLDCERAALGLSTKGIECSCSPSLPTPTASDWRGGKRKRKPGTQANLRDVFTQTTGWLYLHPEDLEVVNGFPATWSELEGSATQSIPLAQNGLATES
jgi:hypothetical protein